MAGFEYTEVGTWLSDLPDELVASVGQSAEPDAGFAFEVRADPVDVSVIGSDDGGPLVIETTVTFAGGALAAIRGEPERFFAEASAILAGAPGFHRLVDADGHVADAESVSGILLRHHVYPDGASKHAVLTGVVDLLTAATHLHDTGERLAAGPGDP